MIEISITLGVFPWLSWGIRLLTLLRSWGRLNPMTVGPPLGSCLVTMFSLDRGASGEMLSALGTRLLGSAMAMERGIIAIGMLTFFLMMTGGPWALENICMNGFWGLKGIIGG